MYNFSLRVCRYRLSQVLIHNYLDKPVTAAVTLDNADGFFKFVDAENEISSNDGKPATEMTKNVHVNASSISTLTFPISPLKHGIMTLKAKATTPEAGDALVRTLIVKPPGMSWFLKIIFRCIHL